MDWFKKLNQTSSRFLIFLICAVGFLVYSNSLFNGFVWDDEEQVVNNTIIHDLRNLPRLFSGSTFNTGGSGRLSGYYYRPMMTLSFALNWALWGNRALGFHLFQIILHLSSSVLVFLLFRILFQKAKFSGSQAAAFLSAFVFAVHPANVEAVSYIASTQETLYVFFSLLSLFFFTKTVDFKKSLVRGLPFVFLAFLSKESAIVLVPIIAGFLLIFRSKKQAFYFGAGVLALFLFYVLLRVGLAKISLTPPHFSPIARADFLTRLQTLPFVLSSYFRLFFFPKNLSISHHEIIGSLNFLFWRSLFLVLTLTSFLLIWLYKTKSKLGLFFFLWATASLGLVSNLFPLDMTFAERWFYFPQIAFMGLIGTIILNWKKSLSFLSKGVFILIIVIVFLFSARTFVRNLNWRDGLTLYTHDISYSRNSFDLENNLGVELFRVGKIQEAKAHFEKSIELEPGWWFAYNNLGAVYEREGNLEKAASFYQESINLSDYYLAYENLCFLMLNHYSLKETIDFCQEAVLKLPQNPKIRKALAIAYYRGGEKEKAAGMAKAAFSLEPSQENYALMMAILRGDKI